MLPVAALSSHTKNMWTRRTLPGRCWDCCDTDMPPAAIARPPSARAGGKAQAPTPRSARKTPSPKTSGKKKKSPKASAPGSPVDTAFLLGEDEAIIEEDEEDVPTDAAALLREALSGTPRMAADISDRETGSPASKPGALSAAATSVAPTAVVQLGRETPVVLAASPAADPPTIARAHSPSPGRPRSPEPFDDDHTHEEGTVEDTAASTKDHRHRRVLKHGPGQKLGVTLSTHPTLAGVYIVSDLVLDDACARNGVRVGDLISKVNGERMANVNQAVKRIDDIWSHEAADPTKDRLKLSLADRTSARTPQASASPPAHAPAPAHGQAGQCCAAPLEGIAFPSPTHASHHALHALLCPQGMCTSSHAIRNLSASS